MCLQFKTNIQLTDEYSLVTVSVETTRCAHYISCRETAPQASKQASYELDGLKSEPHNLEPDHGLVGFGWNEPRAARRVCGVQGGCGPVHVRHQHEPDARL